ncbi:Uncharacterized protein At5g39865 [Linum perenne]
MWPDWLRSPGRVSSPSSSRSSALIPSSAHRKKFSCSSFKDIHTLVSEPDHGGSITIGSSPPSISPRSASIFHRVRISTSVLRYLRKSLPPTLPSPPQLQHQQQSECIVLYFTSLRVVRRTFEDCRTVRSILRGFRVPIDERDLSMDGKYLGEVQDIVGSSGKVTLPLVLIGGKCFVGADVIRELHESGELKKMIGGLPESAVVATSNECEVCGGLRFVMCEECSGSHKIYSEKQGFRSCNSCNVNGLVRCPDCYPAARRRMSIA